MHELLLARLQADPTLHLARLRSDPDCSLLAAFRAGERAPRWMAKVAYQASGRARLRRDHAALRHLAPTADMLRVPAVLAWHDADESTCLIETGMPGWPVTTLPRPEHVHIAWAWLQSFQASTAAPDTALPREHPDPALAAPLLRHVAGLPASDLSWVAVHGDFWWGNILWDGCCLAVIDWNGLHHGSPLDDLFTLVFRLPGERVAGADGRLRLLRQAFFDCTPIAFLVRRMALQAMGSATAAGAEFYRFLLHRMRWEMGLEWQPRSQRECYKAREEWTLMVRWLVIQDFPNPFAL